jgi:hypothetical protein
MHALYALLAAPRQVPRGMALSGRFHRVPEAIAANNYLR